MALILPRRRFLAGLVDLVAAPAVVKASGLMKIVAPPVTFYDIDNSYETYTSWFRRGSPISSDWRYVVRIAMLAQDWRAFNPVLCSKRHKPNSRASPDNGGRVT